MTTTPLISIDAAKLQLDMTGSDGSDDPEIYDMILAASDMINERCGFSAVASYTEESTPTRVDRWGVWTVFVQNTPVTAVTSITPLEWSGAAALNLTGIDIDGNAGVLYLRPQSAFPGGRVRVVYSAGRSEIPAALQTACRFIVQWLWRSQRGGGQTVIGQANEEPSAAPGMYGYPPDIDALLAPFQRGPTLA